MNDDGKSCAAIRAELAEAKALVARWVDAATMAIERRDAAIRERDAYKRAKAENDDRFMGERDEARRERDTLRAELDALKAKLSTSEPTKAPTDTRPVVKVGQVEPFELVSTGRPIAEYAATPNECAIRDRIQEIECRLAKLEASK